MRTSTTLPIASRSVFVTVALAEPMRTGPSPVATARSTAGSAASSSAARGLSWLPPNADVFTTRSARNGAWRFSSRVAFNEATTTVIIATTATPTTSAVAVDALRRGLRRAFSSAKARRHRARDAVRGRARSPSAARPREPPATSRPRGPAPPPPHRASDHHRSWTPIAPAAPRPSNTSPAMVRRRVRSRDSASAARNAATGGIAAARRLGTCAATTVTTTPTAKPITTASRAHVEPARRAVRRRRPSKRPLQQLGHAEPADDAQGRRDRTRDHALRGSPIART